jgi:hypothetical protein
VLVLRARGYLPFISDDALISLRYSERLLEGRGLTWNDGERVEGYSNLLWVLLVAAGGWVSGAELVTVAWVLGVAAMALACLAPFFVRPLRGLAELCATAGASLVLALSAPLAVWAVGGLEQALLAALLAGALVLVLGALAEERPGLPSLASASLLLGLLSLTRPDGVLFALSICTAAVLGAATLGARVRWLLLLVFPGLLLWAQLAFRLAYYGDWVPNTSYAKLHFTGHRLAGGAAYLLGAARALPLLAAGIGAALVLLATGARRRALVLLAPAVVWIAYVMAIGGDIFPAYRHVVPVLILCALALGELLFWLGSRGGSGLALGLVVAAALGAGGWVLERSDAEIQRARDERWEWEGAVLGRILRTAFGEARPLLAVDPAGCLPYFSKLPALDMLGLNDRHIATHPSADLGHGTIGHELGDGAYVLGREPDLFVFCRARGAARPCYRSGIEAMADPAFQRDYTLVRLLDSAEAGGLSLLWVRKEGRIGIARRADSVRVPGFLFTGPQVESFPIDEGRSLAARFGPRRPARLEGVSLPAGTWHAGVGPELPVFIRIARAGATEALAEGLGTVTLLLGEETCLDLELQAESAGPVLVKELVLER